MNSYEAIRRNRVESGKYAAVAKMEVSTLAASLRISCTALKHEAIKARVGYVLTQALYNADDTMVDGYGSPERLEYPTREAFWAVIFRASVQDVASREGARVAKFFTSRGVHV